jgi:asparagine synthase (glutamine-hydrolysing)
MCGICGFFDAPAEGARERLQAMAGAIAHRGPDGTGMWVSPFGTTGLANTRLAIIDLEFGVQPMWSPDGRHVIVFNGEIYNYQELRDELSSRGHRFQTLSDTEVLLHAFLEWRSDCLLKLRGMFAFAVFDTVGNKLFLARDRTGIKPLYYHRGPRGFFFASEIKSILVCSEIPRRLNYEALADFAVLGYPLLPSTLFADCAELAPGCWMELDTRGSREARYWKWQRRESLNGGFSLERLEGELIESLREHLRADVPLAAFLSGGIDSSLLSSLITRRLKRDLKTFTVKFDEREYDESAYARAVAEHLGTEHHEIKIGSGEFDMATIEKVLDQFDQPFADSSAIPTYLLSRAIRQHVKVVIGGDGGDEMFGGYPRFRYAEAARRLGRVPRWVVQAAESSLDTFQRAVPNHVRRARRFLRALKNRNGDRLITFSAYNSPDELEKMLSPGALRQIESYQVAFANDDGWQDPGGSEFVDATIQAVLPGDYLRKIDVMSSAHGLEVRVPFLGNQILEMAAEMPNEAKYSWTQNKIALRTLAAHTLPRNIVKKPKWGFGIPLDSYLGALGRREVDEILGSPTARVRQIVRSEYVDNLLHRFIEQKWDRARISRLSIYQRVYSLWSLERWMSKWQVAL